MDEALDLVRNLSILVYMYIFVNYISEMSTRRPVKNSDREEKSDVKSGLSLDKII